MIFTMSQSNLLADTDSDSLHKFKVMGVQHLTAAAMVTAAPMTIIMMVTPILINEDDDYGTNDGDHGNWNSQCWWPCAEK